MHISLNNFPSCLKKRNVQTFNSFFKMDLFDGPFWKIKYFSTFILINYFLRNTFSLIKSLQIFLIFFYLVKNHLFFWRGPFCIQLFHFVLALCPLCWLVVLAGLYAQFLDRLGAVPRGVGLSRRLGQPALIRSVFIGPTSRSPLAPQGSLRLSWSPELGTLFSPGRETPVG